jgi:PKD repeat protein
MILSGMSMFFSPITVDVADSREHWNLDWVIGNVSDTDGPIANAGVDQVIDQGGFVIFDGSGSWDDIGITSYTWSFMDGTLQTFSGVEWLYFFNTAGTYIVTLNVTDADGNWDNDIMVVTVNDTTLPIAEAGPNLTVDEGAVATFDGSASIDNIGVVNYTWTFIDSGAKTLWGVSPTYLFARPGIYTVTLTVKDAVGLQNTDIVLVTVRNTTPPVITDTTAGWAVNGQMFNVTCYVTDNYSPIDNVFINYSFVTAYGTDGPFNVTMNGHYYIEFPVPQYARKIHYTIQATDADGISSLPLEKELDAKSTEEVTLLYSGALYPLPPLWPARYAHAMDYDSQNDVMVLFGGYDASVSLSDTWTYNVDTQFYNEPTPISWPSATRFMDMVFDPISKKTILFGGFEANVGIYEYDAASNIWSGPFTPGGGPPETNSHSMAYDPVKEVIVCFGGVQSAGQSRNTWEYHPVERYWTGPYSNPSMAVRSQAAMEWDPTIQKMVMFGGSSAGSLSDTWEYDTTAHIWTGPYNPATRPAARYGMEMVYIPTTGRMTLFGGYSGSIALSDTWEYDASMKIWTGPFNPANKPSARFYYGMAYDSQSDIFAIHGGTVSGSPLIDINEGHYDYAPVSRAGSNLFVNEGTPLSFNSAASADDVAIANYTWTFNDAGAKTLWGSSPSYSFTTPGTYLVELKVKDVRNQWDSDWILATVNSTEVPFNVPLIAGWNLVSIPLNMDNISVENVFSSISGKWDVVKYYETLDVADPWKTYRQGSSVNDLSNLGRTMGFWLHMVEPCWLNVSGNVPVSTAITLHAGWNLVGYPNLGERAISVALAGTGYDAIEGFIATAPFIQPLVGTYMMKPGEGYWVHVPADTIWTINW